MQQKRDYRNPPDLGSAYAQPDTYNTIHRRNHSSLSELLTRDYPSQSRKALNKTLSEQKKLRVDQKKQFYQLYFGQGGGNTTIQEPEPKKILKILAKN